MPVNERRCWIGPVLGVLVLGTVNSSADVLGQFEARIFLPIVIDAPLEGGPAAGTPVSSDTATPSQSMTPDPTPTPAPGAADLEVVTWTTHAVVDGEGAPFRFLVEAVNLGGAPALEVRISDWLPAGMAEPNIRAPGDWPCDYDPVERRVDCRKARMEPGERVFIGLEVLAPRLPPCSRFENRATIAADAPGDPRPANDQDAVAVEIGCSDLQLLARVPAPPEGRAHWRQGEVVDLELEWHNLGLHPARGLLLMDSLLDSLQPIDFRVESDVDCRLEARSDERVGFRCTRDQLDPGEVVTTVVRLEIRAPACGDLGHGAVLVATEGHIDPNTINNGASADIVVGDCQAIPTPTLMPTPTAWADLELQKSVDRSVVSPGETLQYELRMTNHGPLDVDALSVLDLLPVDLVYISDTLRFGATLQCRHARGQAGRHPSIYCELAEGHRFEADEQAAITYQAAVATPFPGTALPPEFVNEAILTSSTQYDPQLLNNIADVTVRLRTPEPAGIAERTSRSGREARPSRASEGRRLLGD